MTLLELKKQIDKAIREGTPKDTPVSVDLGAFDLRRKVKTWNVMEVRGLYCESIELSDENGNSVSSATGELLCQFNLILN